MRRLGLLLGAIAISAAAPVHAQVPVDRRAAIAPDASIRIHNLVGSTRVIGWDRDSIVLTGTVPEPRRLYFGASGGGAKLGVESPPDDPSGGRPAQIEVRVPRRARVWIKSATGDIEVSGVDGGLDLYAVSGAITVLGQAGTLNVESMDGPVTIEDAAPWTRVKTASGTITAAGGDDVVLNSVSGLITWRAMGFRRARLESVTGDIRFTGAPDPGGRLQVESHSGRIALDLPRDIRAEFDIQNLYGAIRNTLTDRSPRRLPDLQGWALMFATDPGGADIVIRSFRGEIMIQ